MSEKISLDSSDFNSHFFILIGFLLAPDGISDCLVYDVQIQ